MMSKKKIVKLNLNQVKEFLLKKNLVIKKNRKSLFSNDFKSFNYTFLSSLVIVAIFFKNKKTKRLNILFKRSDGNIGWLDPKK